MSENAAETLGLPADKLTAIYNPVVTADLPARMAETPNHPWFVDGAAPVILAAGQMIEQKGLRGR